MIDGTRRLTAIFWLWLAIAVGTALRVVAVFYFNPLDSLFSDPGRHWQNAGRFTSPGLMGGFDPFLYQLYLFLVRKCTGDSAVGIAVLTSLLSASMPWIFYRAARSLEVPKVPALVYWALLVWMPSLVEIYGYFMMETLVLPLIGLALWATGRACRRGDLSSFLLMAGIWTLAGLTKTHAAPLAVICWCYALFRNSRPLRSASFSVGLVVVLLVPNTLRTIKVLGYAAPLGSDYIVKIQQRSDATAIRIILKKGKLEYSSPSCHVAPLEPLSMWCLERALKQSVHEIRVNEKEGKRDWELALGAVSRSPGVWWRQLGENIVLFLFSPSWPDSNTNRFVGFLNHHSRWLWAPLVFQVLVGNISILASRRFPLIPVAGTAMLLLIMCQNMVTMEGRYRKPLEPLLLLNYVWLWTPAACRKDVRHPAGGLDSKGALNKG